jgi:subtilisin family serine protease
VLSTWPATLFASCLRKVVDPSGATYCYVQGTSMVSPHVAGVAALVESLGVSNPGSVSALLQDTADNLPCLPDLSIYDFFPAVDNGAKQQCRGGTASNSFKGRGQVNALAAVKKAS